MTENLARGFAGPIAHLSLDCAGGGGGLRSPAQSRGAQLRMAGPTACFIGRRNS